MREKNTRLTMTKAGNTINRKGELKPVYECRFCGEFRTTFKDDLEEHEELCKERADLDEEGVPWE